MNSSWSLAGLAMLGLGLAACGESGAADGSVDVAQLPLASMSIDGSDDVLEPAEAPAPAGPANAASEAGTVAPPAAGGEADPEGPAAVGSLPADGGGSAAKAGEASEATDPAAEAGAPQFKRDSKGRIVLGFNALTLDELDDVELEDLLDALLYPDEYEDADREFPAQIQPLDKQEVALKGYMIPVVWEETEVLEFMLVRDLLACCFGGAPQPDEWVSVKMPEGEGAEYFSFIPVIVYGTFHIAALEDEAGYAAGCYRMDGTKVVKEP